jgi:hypothetical protein
MSAPAASMSAPTSLLASATLYQVPGNAAPGKSRKTLIAPAEPSVAPVAVQASGSNVAAMTMGDVLSSVAPQMFAAA